MSALLELVDVHRTYLIGESTVQALRGVSVTIEQGEFVAIMGPSGSGKSSLLQILGLLDTPDKGNYLLFGHNVNTMKEDEQAGLRNTVAGFVFQQFHLLKRMNIVDNVRLPHIYSGIKGDFRKEAIERLKQVGLELDSLVCWVVARMLPRKCWRNGRLRKPAISGMPCWSPAR